MDKAFDNVLRRYTERLDAEAREIEADPAAAYADPDKLLLAVGEDVGRLLHALIVSRGATNILELGTSYGYSTLFLASAAQKTGGRVITMDVARDKQDYARSELRDAGLDQFVSFEAGDALELIEQAEGPFDFVLLDLWKHLYVDCLERFRPKLAPQAIVVADNMLYPEKAKLAGETYRAAVRADGGFQTLLLPVGQGIEISCLWD